MKVSRSALEAWRTFEQDQHELVQEMIAYEEDMWGDSKAAWEADYWASIDAEFDRWRDEDHLDQDDYGDLHAYYEYEDYYP